MCAVHVQYGILHLIKKAPSSDAGSWTMQRMHKLPQRLLLCPGFPSTCPKHCCSNFFVTKFAAVHLMPTSLQSPCWSWLRCENTRPPSALFLISFHHSGTWGGECRLSSTDYASPHVSVCLTSWSKRRGKISHLSLKNKFACYVEGLDQCR